MTQLRSLFALSIIAAVAAGASSGCTTSPTLVPGSEEIYSSPAEDDDPLLADGETDIGIAQDPDAEPDDEAPPEDAEVNLDPEADRVAELDDELATEPALDVSDPTGGVEEDDDSEELQESVMGGEVDDGGGSESTSETAAVDPSIQVALATIPSKIRYILVIVKENHTFDNYFTGFPGATSSKHAWKYNGHHRHQVLRPFAPNGALPASPGHSHHKALAAYRNGHMDGFGVNPGKVPFMRYKKSQIPFYWKYASEYALADHMFSTTLGPSSPGHEVFWFGRSTTLDNPKCHLPGGVGCGRGCLGNHLTATAFSPSSGVTKTVKPCFNLPSLPDHLPQGFTWFDYGGAMAMQIKSQAHVNVAAHYGTTTQVLKDLRADKLHNLMIVHATGAVSEHPPEGPCKGERFTVDAVNAAMSTPEWNEMAIIVTWDDWGGFYDHVKPKVHRAHNGRIFGNGFRLPLLIISPYAKKGFIIKNNTEQASVPKLVEQLWGMPFMSTRNAHARDGVAGSLLGAFNFNQAPRPPMHLTRRSCPGDVAHAQ